MPSGPSGHVSKGRKSRKLGNFQCHKCGELLRHSHPETIPAACVAISQAAFDAIARTLPFGSVGYENATDERGRSSVRWLTGKGPCAALVRTKSGRRPQSRLWLGVYRRNLPRIPDFNQTATWRLCFMGEQQDKRPVDGAKGGSAQVTGFDGA